MITLESNYGTFELKFLWVHNEYDNEFVYDVFQNGKCIGDFVTIYDYCADEEECEMFVEDFGRWCLEEQINKKFVANETKYISRENTIEQVEKLFNVKVDYTLTDVTLREKFCLTCVTEKYFINFYVKNDTDIISNVTINIILPKHD